MIAIEQIIRSQRKTVSLIVTGEGKLVVRAPLHFPKSRIIELVEQKAGWIEKRLAIVRSSPSASQQVKLTEGSQLLFLGQRYQLAISDHASPLLYLDSHFHLARKAVPAAEKVFTRWYRLQAANYFGGRSSLLAKQFGFTFRKVKITSARTRWGSCSSTGTLSFTWRLVMAPQAVIDYVIIHELVHTVEHNHHKRFWEKVVSIVPEYKQHIRWLKENGSSLYLGG